MLIVEMRPYVSSKAQLALLFQAMKKPSVTALQNIKISIISW